MKFDPAKHDRRSIRLKGHNYASAGAYFITICTHQRQCLFGDILDGVMELNEYGTIVRSHWLNLPRYHPHLRLDEFVFMPNHIHGILVLIDNAGGAGFVWNIDHPVGAGFEGNITPLTDQLSAKPAPTTIPTPHHSKRHGIPEIIRGFKTFSARRINQIRNAPGTPVWQRNYYECIIRDQTGFENIRKYVQNNPLKWDQDQLHAPNS
jgi:putative transposase